MKRAEYNLRYNRQYQQRFYENRLKEQQLQSASAKPKTIPIIKLVDSQPAPFFNEYLNSSEKDKRNANVER